MLCQTEPRRVGIGLVRPGAGLDATFSASWTGDDGHEGDGTIGVITFYSISGEYGCFSNFAPHPITLKGRIWPTSEHYFQAQKFAGTLDEEEVRQANSPMVAARMGRSRKRPLRHDWEQVKDAIMHEAVRAKFTQHAGLREALLATGDAQLVEHTVNDAYWGDGGDGTGKNMLGQILMQVREQLRAETRSSRAIIRSETSGDEAMIREVNRLAFGRADEARLVDALRDGGYATLSLAAEESGRIVGHILFSTLVIATSHGEMDALSLAPLAVVPSHQRKGIGSSLVGAGLCACRAAGHRLVIVLGHPEFYPRFGFSASLAEPLRSPYAGPAFMALELAPDALRGVEGDVQYPPPFDRL